MTKDTVQEQVEDILHDAESYLADYSNKEWFAGRLTQALTQAEQRGAERAIEKMKMEGKMGKLTPFQETVNTYIENRGKEILQTLQDYQS